MDEPQLAQGSQGDWVTYLQELLERTGHSPGAVDGVFGHKTAGAVRAFQTEHGLAVDGIVGPRTWAALNAATGAGGTAEAGGTAGAGGTAEAGAASGTASGSAEGDVPPELVQAGAPASLSEWSDEQKEAFFEGTTGDAVDADSPEDVPVLAMAEGSGDGGEYA